MHEKVNPVEWASFDEVPPGMESGFVPSPHIGKNTYQPSKLMNYIPVISRFTSCRFAGKDYMQML
jgi:hypothetical protein